MIITVSRPEYVLHMSASIEHDSVTVFHVAHLAGRGTVEAHNVVVCMHAARGRVSVLRALIDICNVSDHCQTWASSDPFHDGARPESSGDRRRKRKPRVS